MWIVLDGDLCTACEASADARRPFNRTAASCSIGPDVFINEGNSFGRSK